MNLKNSSLTLDKKHNLLLKEFENNQKLIPKYYEKIKKLENLKKNNKKKILTNYLKLTMKSC